jgi:hypothetical protein
MTWYSGRAPLMAAAWFMLFKSKRSGGPCAWPDCLSIRIASPLAGRTVKLDSKSAASLNLDPPPPARSDDQPRTRGATWTGPRGSIRRSLDLLSQIRACQRQARGSPNHWIMSATTIRSLCEDAGLEVIKVTQWAGRRCSPLGSSKRLGFRLFTRWSLWRPCERPSCLCSRDPIALVVVLLPPMAQLRTRPETIAADGAGWD